MPWLLTLAFASTVVDMLFSARRIEKYGVGVENNWLVRWLCVHLNSPLEGSFVGIMLPSCVLMVGFVLAGLDNALAIYVGARLMLNWEQFASMRLEPILDKQLALARKDLPTPQGPSAPDGH